MAVQAAKDDVEDGTTGALLGHFDRSTQILIAWTSDYRYTEAGEDQERPDECTDTEQSPAL